MSVELLEFGKRFLWVYTISPLASSCIILVNGVGGVGIVLGLRVWSRNVKPIETK